MDVALGSINSTVTHASTFFCVLNVCYCTCVTVYVQLVLAAPYRFLSECKKISSANLVIIITVVKINVYKEPKKT